MSVTGFRIDGTIQKYDYNALENIPSSSQSTGITPALKLALLQLASKVPYIDEHGEDYYQDLYDALYSNFFNVTYDLVGCSSSNTDLVIKEGEAYSTTINVSHAYSLSGATVSIKMGGADVTGLYSNGSISIPNVTGDLVIIVRAVPSGVTVSSISATYTQSGTVYTTDSLDDLKQDLVVTATWSDSTTDVVPSSDYTLSGTLTAGTSTITVNYFDQSDTFDVTVTKYSYSGIVDGTYATHFGNPILTIENNTVKDIINVSTYTTVENIRLTREIVLHAGDVIRFTAYCPNWSLSNPSRYHNIAIPNSEISSMKLQDVYRKAETTATATVPSDYTFTAFNMSCSGNWEGAAFRLSVSVNGEEMF